MKKDGKFNLKKVLKFAISPIAIFLFATILISCHKPSQDPIEINKQTDYQSKLNDVSNKLPILRKELEHWYNQLPTNWVTQLNQIEQSLTTFKADKQLANYDSLIKTHNQINATISWVKTQRMLKEQELIATFKQLEDYYNSLLNSNKYNQLWLIEQYEQIKQLQTQINPLLDQQMNSNNSFDKYDDLILKVNDFLKTMENNAIKNKTRN